MIEYLRRGGYMKKIFLIFTCLVFVTILSSCKSDDSSACFTEEVDIKREIRDFDSIVPERMVELSDGILIVKFTDYDKDSSEGTMLAYFNIQKIEMLKEDKIINNEVILTVSCELSDEGEYRMLTHYAMGADSGRIRLGEYYLIFAENGLGTDDIVKSYITYYFELEGYDNSKSPNEQNDDIKEIISKYFDEY